MLNLPWQDLAITGAVVSLGIGTVLALFKEPKPPRWMSTLYTVALAVISVSVFSLGLWVSSAAAAFQGLAWLALLVQSFRHKMTYAESTRPKPPYLNSGQDNPIYPRYKITPKGE